MNLVGNIKSDLTFTNTIQRKNERKRTRTIYVSHLQQYSNITGNIFCDRSQ